MERRALGRACMPCSWGGAEAGQKQLAGSGGALEWEEGYRSGKRGTGAEGETDLGGREVCVQRTHVWGHAWGVYACPAVEAEADAAEAGAEGCWSGPEAGQAQLKGADGVLERKERRTCGVSKMCVTMAHEA